MVQLPIICVCSVIAASGPYWIVDAGVGLNPDGTRYLQYVAIFTAHLYMIESLGILTAAIIPNFILGLIVFCSTLSQLFIYNGFFVSPENIPVYLVWLYYLSPFAYTTQALFKIVFDGLDVDGYAECLQIREYPCYGEDGNEVLESISDDVVKYNDVNVGGWFAIVAAFAVLFRLQFWFFLRKSVY